MSGHRSRKDVPAALLSRVVVWLFTVLAVAEAPFGASEIFGGAERRAGNLAQRVSAEPKQQLTPPTEHPEILAIEETADPVQTAYAQDLGEDVTHAWRQDAIVGPLRPARERIPASQAFPSTHTGFGARAPPQLA